MKNAFYSVFKKPFFGRFMKPWRWPEGVDQSQWQRQSIKSQSGATLAALLGSAHTEHAKGAVVMSHPMGVAAKGFWMKYGHAELLRQSGYHVMLFDLNGFGESTSTTMDYPLDVLAVGHYLQDLYPELPIAVMGASMGAAMSTCAMALPDHPFKAAVLESAFPTLLHFWRRYPIPKLGVQFGKLIHPAGERRMRPIHAAENLVGNPDILLIYGEEDIYTPIRDGKLLFNALQKKTQTTFWQVPDAEHTHAYMVQPDEYAKRVIKFLDCRLVQKNIIRTRQNFNHRTA